MVSGKLVEGKGFLSVGCLNFDEGCAMVEHFMCICFMTTTWERGAGQRRWSEKVRDTTGRPGMVLFNCRWARIVSVFYGLELGRQFVDLWWWE